MSTALALETRKLGSGLRFFDLPSLQASSHNKPSCSSSALGGAAMFLALTHVATSPSIRTPWLEKRALRSRAVSITSLLAAIIDGKALKNWGQACDLRFPTSSITTLGL